MHNVLFVVFEAAIGGHIISAFTVAKKIQASGNNTFFAGRQGQLSGQISETMPFIKVDIPLTHQGRETYFTWESFSAIKQLREIVYERNISIIHAFDARSYFHCYPVGLLTGIPVLCTLCGGTDPYYNIPMSHKLIVFSEEQKNKMVGVYGWRPEKISVYRARVDLSKILSSTDLITAEEASSIGIDTSLPCLMMLTSFGDLKIHGILNLIDAVNLVLERLSISLLLIGGKPSSNRDKIRESAELVNRRYGVDRIKFIEQVPDAYRFLKMADIVLGVGRSAFEGMAYGKPTIIVGNNGYSGIVCPSSIESLAYYNFSGRNQLEMSDPKVLAEAIIDLLQNQCLLNSAGSYGKKYVEREIDVAVGINFILNTYDEMVNYSYSILFKCCQHISYIKCLLPILIDNFTHKIKINFRNLLSHFNLFI